MATDRRFARAGRLLLVAALLQLAGCASAPRARAPLPAAAPVSRPAPRPPSTRPTAKPPAPIVRPTATPATPVSTALLDPIAYRRERQTARAAMAGRPRESLARTEAGYYLDVLQARVKPMVRPGLSLSRQASRIDVELSGRAGFVAGSGQISPLMREMLARLAAVLAEYRKTVLTLRVRGDDSAPPAGRARLAELRGLAVTAYLVDAGVPRQRILLTSAAAAANPSAGGQLVLQIEPVVRPSARERGR